jgi:drug/metabolite transporter (DMT)-like permease
MDEATSASQSGWNFRTLATVKKQALGTLCVALAAASWGTWALFLRGHGLPPVWQALMILITIALAALPQALRASLRRPARTAGWGLLGLAALADAGNYFCYFAALDRGPIALAVLTHYLAPVVVAALAPLLLRERLTARTRAALAVSLCGLALLVLGDGGLPYASVATAILGACSALCYGANTVITKKLLDSFSPAEVLAYHCLLSAALIGVAAGGPPPARAFLWSPILGALFLGAASGWLFYFGLRLVPASRAAVLTYFEPLVAALVGYHWFAEPMGPAGVVGGLMIAAGGIAVALWPSAQPAEVSALDPPG